MKYLKKTIECGLYMLAFLLPVQVRWIIRAAEINGGYWEYGTYSLYGTDMLLILVLLLSIIAIASGRMERSNFAYSDINQRLPRHNKISDGKMLYWFIGGLLLSSAVSVFFAHDKALALYKLSWLVLGAGLFCIIAFAEENKIKFIWSMFAGMAVQAALAIWQFLTQSSFASKWLGMALHGGADLGTSVVEFASAGGIAERWLRAYGGFDHPNILGGAMAVCILALAGEVIASGRAEKKFMAIVFVFLILFSAALFFSFSRSAWIALASGMIVMLSRAVLKKDLAAQKIILQMILIAGAVFFVLFLPYRDPAIARLGASGRLEIKSINERRESVKIAPRIIKNNLFFGVGIGNYTLALNRMSSGRAEPAHNVFLLALSEIGIFGFIFFTALLFFVFSGTENFAVLIALAIIMLFDHWLWSLHFGVLFFFFVLSLAFRASKRHCG